MKPMLAATITDLSEIKYPVYASPKLDGIRGVVIDGKLKSRSLKDIPNPFVSDRFSKDEFSGLDGELILGDPTAKDVYRQTNGACARRTGTPDVKFFVFDCFTVDEDFSQRLHRLAEWADYPDNHIVPLVQHLIKDETELLKYEADTLDLGYEGLILRSPEGVYKHGRSTMKQQGMMKLKRFEDSEAIILEVIEEFENTNEKKTNELGRSKRSSHKAGKLPKGIAGGFRVADTKTGVEFDIGSGLTDEDGVYFWKNRKKVVGQVIKYKHFPIGVKDKPRHPVYLGKREEWDV